MISWTVAPPARATGEAELLKRPRRKESNFHPSIFPRLLLSPVRDILRDVTYALLAVFRGAAPTHSLATAIQTCVFVGGYVYLSAACFALAGFLCLPAVGQISVLTGQYDNGRTGANLNETTLNTSNVNAAGFGKLFSRNVDGAVMAQPLYVSQLSMSSGLHNVVFVAVARSRPVQSDPQVPSPRLQTVRGRV
jgi:hypothetical protein